MISLPHNVGIVTAVKYKLSVRLLVQYMKKALTI